MFIRMCSKNIKDIITTHPPVNPIVIGKIKRAYGVRGWVKIVSFTDKSENIFCYAPWLVFLKNQWKLIRLECWKSIKEKYIVKISGVSNREMAMLLTNSNLIIGETQLPFLCNNEYYWKDIIGCTVITVQGNDLGCVDYIIETIAHDVLVVKLFKQNFVKTKNCLIPFIYNRIIKNVNLIKNVIVVDWNFHD